MTFAIKEINHRSDLLPHLKLGFDILDSCNDISVSLRGALLLVNGQPERDSRVFREERDRQMNNTDRDLRSTGLGLGCGAIRRTVSPVIIGDAASGVSMAVLRTLSSFQIPLVRLCDLWCCTNEFSLYFLYLYYTELCFTEQYTVNKFSGMESSTAVSLHSYSLVLLLLVNFVYVNIYIYFHVNIPKLYKAQFSYIYAIVQHKLLTKYLFLINPIRI